MFWACANQLFITLSRRNLFWKCYWSWGFLPVAYAAVVTIGSIALGYGPELDQTMHSGVLFGIVFCIHAFFALPMLAIVCRRIEQPQNQGIRRGFGIFSVAVIVFDLVLAEALIVLDESSLYALLFLMPVGAIVYTLLILLFGFTIYRATRALDLQHLGLPQTDRSEAS